MDRTVYCAILREELTLYIPYSIDAIEREIDNWPNKQNIHRKQQGTGPYRYKGLDYSQ